LLWKGKLNRKHSNHLIHFGIPLFSLLLCGCTPASLMPGLLSLVAPVALALLAIPVVIALSKSGKIPAVKDLLPEVPILAPAIISPIGLFYLPGRQCRERNQSPAPHSIMQSARFLHYS
jgi:hypothetical protein